MPDIRNSQEIHNVLTQAVTDREFSIAPSEKNYETINDSIESAQEMLAEEVSEDQGLTETLEAMSLRLGSKVEAKINQNRLKETRLSRMQKALLPLAKIQKSSTQFLKMSDQFKKIEEKNLLKEMKSEALSNGAMLLMISDLMDGNDKNSIKFKKYQEIMASLSQEKGWAVDVFSCVELGAVEPKDLQKLKYLYQKAQDDYGIKPGLASWFNEIKSWPDRKQKIKVLLRSLGLEFSLNIRDQVEVRITNAMADLKKLWFFLDIQDQARTIEKNFELAPDSVLNEAIILLGEEWTHPNWIAARAEKIGVKLEHQSRYAEYMFETMQTLPEACFRSDEHRERILESLKEIQSPH